MNVPEAVTLPECDVCKAYMGDSPLRENCGGTCLMCMAAADDPECVQSLGIALAKALRPKLNFSPVCVLSVEECRAVEVLAGPAPVVDPGHHP